MATLKKFSGKLVAFAVVIGFVLMGISNAQANNFSDWEKRRELSNRAEVVRAQRAALAEFKKRLIADKLDASKRAEGVLAFASKTRSSDPLQMEKARATAAEIIKKSVDATKLAEAKIAEDEARVSKEETQLTSDQASIPPGELEYKSFNQTAQELPPEFQPCAKDGDVCKIPARTPTKVYYGHIDHKKFVVSVGTGQFACLPDKLGVQDPVPGVVKTCYTDVSVAMADGTYSSAGETVQKLPGGFSPCATDGQLCKVPQGVPVTIYYGTPETKLVVSKGKGHVTCLPDKLGVADPVPGTLKSCYTNVDNFRCTIDQGNSAFQRVNQMAHLKTCLRGRTEQACKSINGCKWD